MPVVIRRRSTIFTSASPPPPSSVTPAPTKSPPLGRQRNDDDARALAPIFAEIRKEGHHSIAGITQRLNERGLRAPSGGPFSDETTRRILKDINRLGLGGGPRTGSQALRERHRRRREKEAAEFKKALKELNEMKAQKRLEHPDWRTTRPWLR
jgi:hypothetical protein